MAPQSVSACLVYQGLTHMCLALAVMSSPCIHLWKLLEMVVCSSTRFVCFGVDGKEVARMNIVVLRRKAWRGMNGQMPSNCRGCMLGQKEKSNGHHALVTKHHLHR